jgi:hypothetical protein
MESGTESLKTMQQRQQKQDGVQPEHAMAQAHVGV